jgi:hypothetical protein
MAYKEVAVRVGVAVIAAIMMLEIPGHVWEKSNLEQRYHMKVALIKEFSDNNPFCKTAKMWVVYVQETNTYQIWIRCVDTERRC